MYLYNVLDKDFVSEEIKDAPMIHWLPVNAKNVDVEEEEMQVKLPVNTARDIEKKREKKGDLEGDGYAWGIITYEPY